MSRCGRRSRSKLYIDNNVKVLQALGANLVNTRLEQWQQDRIVKDYVLEFPELREITLFDLNGEPIVSSRFGEPRLTVPAAAVAEDQELFLAPMTVDDDLLPTTTVAIRLRQFDRTEGWLLGEVSLEELWQMVDSIRVGEEGFALVLAQEGQLIAHGDPDEKDRVARGESLLDHPLLVAAAARDVAKPAPPSRRGNPVPADTVLEPPVTEYRDAQGRTLLAVAASIGTLGWTVIVEQPTSEAYRLATAL